MDRWILAKLNKLIIDVTKNMNEYHILEPAREIREFIADFSQWYIRRSRDRFKIEGEDKEYALTTTRYVLLELVKLMAPFTPFTSEQIYRKVRSIDMEKSVHLTEWPKAKSGIKNNESEILNDMEEVRKIVSLGLEARASVGIKVRQPVASLKIKNQKSKIKKTMDYRDL